MKKTMTSSLELRKHVRNSEFSSSHQTSIQSVSSSGACILIEASFPPLKKQVKLPDNYKYLSDLSQIYQSDEGDAKLLREARKSLALNPLDQPISSLQGLRLKSGQSQMDLAQKTGTNQPRISRIENGKEDPSLSFSKKYADALGVSLDELYEAFPSND